jgi:hypothetical protein
MTKEFINHAAPSLISELFWLHKPSHGRADDHMLKIVVPCGLKNQYIKRVIKDWSDGETLKMITNINLVSHVFCKIPTKKNQTFYLELFCKYHFPFLNMSGRGVLVLFVTYA